MYRINSKYLFISYITHGYFYTIILLILSYEFYQLQKLHSICYAQVRNVIKKCTYLVKNTKLGIADFTVHMYNAVG